MNVKFKFLLLISSVVILSFNADAQKRKPYFALDTIIFNTNKIILYSNNTWVYYKSLKDTIIHIDTTTLFTNNWDTKQIFAYLDEKKISPYKYKLKIADTLTHSTIPVYGRIFGGFTYKHHGVDIELSKGQAVVAAFDGKVRYSQYNNGNYGNLIIIRHNNGIETYYAHLSKRLVFSNQKIKAGEVIGYGGSTGRSSAYHLHFETRYHDVALNPYNFFDFDKISSDSIQKYRANTYTYNTNKNDKTFFNNKTTINNINTNTELNNKNTNRICYNSGITGNNNIYNNNSFKYHIVKKGDTLYSIARKNGTSVEKICYINKISCKTTLKIGMTLKVSP